MKLRFPIRLQQLLFAAASALVLVSRAVAQDTIVLTTGAIQQGKILGISPSGKSLEFQVAGTTNKLGLALSGIREVRMNPPAELGQAVAAYQAKDFAKALTLLKPVVDKFKGMP